MEYLHFLDLAVLTC